MGEVLEEEGLHTQGGRRRPELPGAGARTLGASNTERGTFWAEVGTVLGSVPVCRMDVLP